MENEDCVQFLEELYNFYSKLGNVMFAGDFNAQCVTIPISRIAQRKSGIIKQFMRSNSLVPINKTEICTGQNYLRLKSFCDRILLHRITCRSIASLMC